MAIVHDAAHADARWPRPVPRAPPRGIPELGRGTARVSLLVFIEVGAVAEGLAAHTTHIGPLARVRAPVAHELGVAHKSLAAIGADERLLPGVHALVLAQLRAAAEGFATVAAGVGPLAGGVPGPSCP